MHVSDCVIPVPLPVLVQCFCLLMHSAMLTDAAVAVVRSDELKEPAEGFLVLFSVMILLAAMVQKASKLQRSSCSV